MTALQRSTKIVATLGPSSSDAAVLERMFLAGVDVVRLNFSHGTSADHIKRAELVRETCRKVGRAVGHKVGRAPPHFQCTIGNPATGAAK